MLHAPVLTHFDSHTYFGGRDMVFSAPRTPRTVTALLLILVFLMGMTALPAHAQGGTLTIGTNAPVNLDPSLGSNDPEILFNRMIYDYLFDVNLDNQVVPNLANGYGISEDGLVYTVSLLPEVWFQDGTTFDSADVVSTFARLKTIQSPALGLLSGGDFTVEAPDATTVVFTLTAPNADFLFGLAGRLTFIIPEEITEPNVLIEGEGELANFTGTGPFVLVEYKPGESATFVRNEIYHRVDEVLLDEVVHVYIEDPLAQIDALQSGAVDFIFKVPVDQVAVLENAGLNILAVATNQHPVIRIRTAEGFRGEDVRIRQALKLGVNRAELNELILDDLGVVGNNDPIGPLYGDYFATIEQPHDPTAACALILEATGDERISFDFYVVDALGYPDLAAVMQQQWEEACIDVNILVRPENVYYGDNEWLDAELGLTGWGSRPIPQQYLLEAYTTGAPYNESNFSDEEVDTLTAMATLSVNPMERAAIYQSIAAIFAERGPIIVPFFAPMIGATSARVEGLEMNPFPGLTDLRGVSVSE
jgi:peptide/nickel transport system substrate-binding protein